MRGAAPGDPGPTPARGHGHGPPRGGAEATDRTVEGYPSGPVGGDIATGRAHCVSFLRDPLTARPGEPDVAALLPDPRGPGPARARMPGPRRTSGGNGGPAANPCVRGPVPGRRLFARTAGRRPLGPGDACAARAEHSVFPAACTLVRTIPASAAAGPLPAAGAARRCRCGGGRAPSMRGATAPRGGPATGGCFRVGQQR